MAQPSPYALSGTLFPLAESLSSGLLLHRGGKVLYANRAMSRLSGFSAEELIEKDFWAFYPANVSDTIRERGLARLHGDHPVGRYETLLITRCGEERWVELTVSDEEIQGQRTIVCNFIDVTERKRAEAAQKQAQQLLTQIIDADPVPTLVINARHVVTHWNHACEQVIGLPASELVGTCNQWSAFYPSERPIMADLIVSGQIDDMLELYGTKKLRRSPVIEGAYEAEDFFPQMGDKGRWLFFTAAPLRNALGEIIGAIETLQDITERKNAETELLRMHADLEAKVARRTEQLQQAKASLEQDIARRERAEEELLKRYAELTELNCRLQDTRQQLVQSEKMASIGQLAAGVAHEINNPIGYVNSNIRSLKGYVEQLLKVVSCYETSEAALPADDQTRIQAARKDADFDYLRDDIHQLLGESEEGTNRVRQIVQDLRDFSRAETTQDWQAADLHHGLDSTLNIASNEIKYRADIVREYGQLPLVECLPSQLNQVFMNLFVNAAQAMPDGHRGTITIRTGLQGESVWIEVADDGQGIPPDVMDKIFDPFFTTKPIGKGTGLGLSLSYGIVQNHRGNISVSSAPGTGTTFRITLPVHHEASAGAQA
ncbi:PAS domain S-box protein [Zoogloea sp.]|jgi:two-component system NtrC family sensor kinase|uniref:PAS domain S-box protein n=1 Tax=Zoogloea sp. TaxID=49181 RepID=UPI0037DA3B0A